MAPNRPSRRDAISQQTSEWVSSLPTSCSAKSLGSSKIEQVSTVRVFPKLATVESSRKCSWLPPAIVLASLWKARKNAGPQIPSTSKPTLRWNSRTAESVLFAKMPSTRSNANPSSINRCCNCATSSPCITWPGVKLKTRSPIFQRASSSLRNVCGPTKPSTVNPRVCWK